MDVIELYSKDGSLVHTSRSRHGPSSIDDVRIHNGKRYLRDRSRGTLYCRVYVEEADNSIRHINALHDPAPSVAWEEISDPVGVYFEDFNGEICGSRLLPKETVRSSSRITYMDADYQFRYAAGSNAYYRRRANALNN